MLISELLAATEMIRPTSYSPRVGLLRILLEKIFRAKIFSNLHILCAKNAKKTALFELVTGTSLPMSDRIDLIPFARRSPMVVYVRLEG